MSDYRMTIDDVLDDLRSLGFSIGKKALSDCLKDGTFPFAKILNVGPTGRHHFLILRKDYEAWKNNYLFINSDQRKTTNSALAGTEWELISSRRFTQEDKETMWEVIIKCWSKKESEN